MEYITMIVGIFILLDVPKFKKCKFVQVTKKKKNGSRLKFRIKDKRVYKDEVIISVDNVVVINVRILSKIVTNSLTKTKTISCHLKKN